MKLSILGTSYDYKEIIPQSDNRMAGLDGYCDGYKKIIRVNNSLSGNFLSSPIAVKAYKQLIRRHEIIHAFLKESGLDEFGNNELLVDYFAAQFPKMLKTFKKVDGV